MGHTHRYQFCLKKKNQVKSPSPESRVPETGSDPPIGSDRGSGRDKSFMLALTFFSRIFFISLLEILACPFD